MKQEVRSIVGEGCSKVYDCMISLFKQENWSPEQIANYIQTMDETSKSGIHMIALVGDDREMADRIGDALKILEQRKTDAFYKAEQEGTLSEFLGNMSWEDKSILFVDLGLFRDGFESEKPLTEKEQYYSDIINASIQASIEAEAREQGFKDVEAWRAHQRELNAQFRRQHPIMVRPRVGRL